MVLFPISSLKATLMRVCIWKGEKGKQTFVVPLFCMEDIILLANEPKFGASGIVFDYNPRIKNIVFLKWLKKRTVCLLLKSYFAYLKLRKSLYEKVVFTEYLKYIKN